MKLFLILALVGCAVAAPQPRTIIDALGEAGQTTILELIELAGVTDALNGEGPFTAFVPKQEVLDSLPQEILDQLTADLALLTNGLTYHVATGSYMSSDLANDITLPTVQGTPLRVNVYSVGGDTVATVAGVPIDLTMVDIDAGNGVIHFLDYIILNVPEFDTVNTMTNIDEAAFSALLYAAEATGLVSDVVSADGFTLLAPIDSDAFNTAVVDELLADPDALAAILKDHILDTTMYSIGLELDTPYETFGGNSIQVSFNDELGFFISDADGNLLANIIAGDISTTQGVVHVLDRPIVL